MGKYSEAAKFNKDNVPDLVKFVRNVEIYEAGNVVKLFYRGDVDTLYKYPGAIYGISVQRVVNALNNGEAVPYQKDF
jgi:hypothetical protein